MEDVAEPLNTPEMTVNFWKKNVASNPIFDSEKEHLIVICLDTRFKVKGFNFVSIGTINESLAAPREIFRPCVASAAYAFILMHNHPSGIVSPSEADRRLTTRLNECAGIMAIRLLDHVIVGGDQSYSFKEHGLL